MLDSVVWLCVVVVADEDLLLLLSTDSGFSALINARLALGCWSYVEGMSLI